MSSLPVFNSPPCMAWNSTKTQKWNTKIQKYGSGRRKTLSRWSYPEWELNCSYTCLDPDQVEYVAGFFARMRGEAGTFLWMDPDDYRQTGVQIGIGDGVTTGFQLVRNYGGFAEPVRDVVEGTLKLYQDGMLLENTTNLLPKENCTFEGWTQYLGAKVTLTQNQTVPEWGCTDATRIQISGGSNVIKYFYAVGSPAEGVAWSEQVYVKNIGSTTVVVASNLNGLNKSIDPGTAALVEFKLVGNAAGGSAQIQFKSVNISDSLDFIAWHPMAEAKPYCTPYTTGTRTMTNSEGLISFGSAPYKGAILTATFDYYWRVAFDSDEATWENFWYNFYRMRNVKLVTVK